MRWRCVESSSGFSQDRPGLSIWIVLNSLTQNAAACFLWFGVWGPDAAVCRWQRRGSCGWALFFHLSPHESPADTPHRCWGTHSAGFLGLCYPCSCKGIKLALLRWEEQRSGEGRCCCSSRGNNSRKPRGWARGPGSCGVTYELSLVFVWLLVNSQPPIFPPAVVCNK